MPSGSDTFQILENAAALEHLPSVTGAEAIKSVAVFDEAYISQIVFKPDELLKTVSKFHSHSRI